MYETNHNTRYVNPRREVFCHYEHHCISYTNTNLLTRFNKIAGQHDKLRWQVDKEAIDLEINSPTISLLCCMQEG